MPEWEYDPTRPWRRRPTPENLAIEAERLAREAAVEAEAAEYDATPEGQAHKAHEEEHDR